jgi:malate synthase
MDMERDGMERVEAAGLSVARELHDFVAAEALPGTGIEAAAFWSSLAAAIRDLAPENRALLERRDDLQNRIDGWHRERAGRAHDAAAYEAFLREIGYLEPEPPAGEITTQNVDAEIATIAGPQLVVPISNARYALNAANARWGSLYDALYGTDAISEEDGATRSGRYNKVRGAKVIARARAVLDRAAPLAEGSHAEVASYAVEDGMLVAQLRSGDATPLARPEGFVGFRGDPASPTAILLRHNNLHLEIVIDRETEIGRDDPAGISDVVMESAVSTIMDLEDSVAAVDATDKVEVYRNWLGLMTGTLAASLEKGGRTIERRLNPDRVYTAPEGGEVRLHGRTSCWCASRPPHDGRRVPDEGPRCRRASSTPPSPRYRAPRSGARRSKNSRAGSVYIVKPKMHGPEEVASRTRFGARRGRPGLARTTKMGIMDEDRPHHRSTSRPASAAAATASCSSTPGFPRPHRRRRSTTSIEDRADAAQERHDAATPWIKAYADRQRGSRPRLRAPGKAQIGKGMWADADRMADMLAQKIAHPAFGREHRLGAVADRRDAARATYHEVSVADRQAELRSRGTAPLSDILTSPSRARTGRRRPCSRSSTTTRRASSATWCAGSTAGVGCSKSRTSTMSG